MRVFVWTWVQVLKWALNFSERQQQAQERQQQAQAQARARVPPLRILASSSQQKLVFPQLLR